MHALLWGSRGGLALPFPQKCELSHSCSNVEPALHSWYELYLSFVFFF